MLAPLLIRLFTEHITALPGGSIDLSIIMVSGLLHRTFTPRLTANSAAPACFSPLVAHDLMSSYFPKPKCCLQDPQPFRVLSTSRSALPLFSFRCLANKTSPSCIPKLREKYSYRISILQTQRQLSTFPQQQQKTESKSKNETADTTKRDLPEPPKEEGEQEFKKSDRAARAAHINLSARLSKEGKGQGKAGLGEIWRLIQVVRPEIRWLALALVFLVINSSVSMSIPYSIGRILDVATKGDVEDTFACSG